MLNFYFCFAHTPYANFILFHPPHWNLERQIKDKHQHKFGRWLGITAHL